MGKWVHRVNQRASKHAHEALQCDDVAVAGYEDHVTVILAAAGGARQPYVVSATTSVGTAPAAATPADEELPPLALV